MKESPLVEVFFDYVWPWCYFGTVRTERLCREFGATLRWTVFPLHPETPDEGLELEELFAGRGYDIPAMMERLGRVAAEVGLPLGERTRTYNSRRAQQLGKWAESRGRGEAFQHAVYRAYFVEGANIARPEVLAQIAQTAGLAPAEALQALETPSFSAAVEADWERCRALGITSVPTHLAGGRALVGFRPWEDFARLLRPG